MLSSKAMQKQIDNHKTLRSMIMYLIYNNYER